MSRKYTPKISRDGRYQKKSKYYKPGSDGYRFDNGAIAFGKETKTSKEKRDRKTSKPLF